MPTGKKGRVIVLDQALAYHSRGWCVIPIPHGKKAARVKWQPYQKQRPDEIQIRKWFSGNKPRNIAIMTGPISGGLTVIDFDTEFAYQQWAKNNRELAGLLPTVRTGRGWHVYCQSNLSKTVSLPDIDIKASGYVLAPPSRHPSGTLYNWSILPNGPLQELDPVQIIQGNLTQETQETQATQETQETQDYTRNTRDSSSSKKSIELEEITERYSPDTLIMITMRLGLQCQYKKVSAIREFSCSLFI